MDRVILHSDLNNFYATVEVKENPKLKDVPVVVCGKTEERSGIVLAKNEFAKKFGIKTGDVLWQARQKCPSLVEVPPNFPQYVYYSKKVRDIYYRYTDMVEPFGIDECWLDVTGSTNLFGTGEEIANKIRQDVKEELGLTVSIGVSFNKIFAKLGSDMKKPDATTVITKDNFKTKVWECEASDLLGVGRATTRKLSSLGIYKIGDIAKMDFKILEKVLGKNGGALWKYSNALDNSPVGLMGQMPLIKTIGNSVTCLFDLQKDEEVWQVFLALSQDVASRLRKNGLKSSCIQISIKNKVLNFEEHQARFISPTRYSKRIAEKAFEIFKNNYRWEEDIRALGVRATCLVSDLESEQIVIFGNQQKIQKMEELETKLDKVRERYGNDALLPATLIQKIPFNRKTQIPSVLPGSFDIL